jgi:hypothetical protein
MKNLFTSPLTIAISAVLALVVAFLSWLYPLTTEKRELSVAVRQNVEITADVNISQNDSLEFLFNGERVQNLVSTKIRFKNTGNQPIVEADFVQGLRVVFPDDTRIIKYEIVQAQPLQNFSLFQQGFVTILNPNQLNFIPALINPGEVFDLNVLSTRYNGTDELASLSDDLDFEYKIFGISNLNKVKEIKTNGELQFAARESFKEVTSKLLNLAVVFGGFFLLILVFIEVIKMWQTTHKDKRILSPETTQSLASAFLWVFWGLIIGFVCLLIGANI